MKLILVSDLHLPIPGRKLFGLDPLRHAEACIAHINRHHGDADLVVFAGDLANDGEPEAYEWLAASIGRLLPPWRMMMGNHDDRAGFLAAFPGAQQEDGFIQSCVDLGGVRAIMLDTLWPGHVEGLLCEQRLAWLDRQLDTDIPALLFLHHPPFPIGIPALDECGLSAPEKLRALLGKHGNVRHIFAGHVHRLAQGMWGGIPFSTVRGTCHQSALTLAGPHQVSFEAPSCTVILCDGDDIIIHTDEFDIAPA